MKYYITGDTHGDYYAITKFCKDMETTTEDVIVILGDVGLNFYLNGRDEKLKKKLSKLPITLFCIHGNHEERPYMLDGYQEMEWRGAIVYVNNKYPNILFAKDGEIYDFAGKKCVAIGGAYSVDKYYRLERGWTWFSTEQPSDEIKTYVEEQLERNNWKVDYVFTHTAPLKYEPTEFFLSFIDQSTVDKTTEEWLDKIEDKLTYDAWYLGHYHNEKTIDKIHILYKTIMELE